MSIVQCALVLLTLLQPVRDRLAPGRPFSSVAFTLQLSLEDWLYRLFIIWVHTIVIQKAAQYTHAGSHTYLICLCLHDGNGSGACECERRRHTAGLPHSARAPPYCYCYCSAQIPTLSLLLFITLIVVLLLPLTLPTLFSP